MKQMRRDTLRLIALLLLALAPASLAGQAPIRCRRPLSEEDMRVLIEGQVAEKRLRDIVTTCGVGFRLTAEVEQRLRTAGATDVVVAAVRRESEKAESEANLRLRAELALWESIKDSRDIALYEEYLRKFPDGTYRLVAERKLRELHLRREIPAEIEKGLNPGPSPGEPLIVNGVEMEFVSIPPGEFEMGCSPGDSECDGDESPRRRVRITKGFEIGKYEVTQAQWEAVMGNNPSRSKAPDRPV